MFRQLLWNNSNFIDLAKKLISIFDQISVISIPKEITTDQMIIPRLSPTIYTPENNILETSNIITSATFEVTTVFNLPLDEFEFLKKIQIFANLNGVYEFYSESTDLASRKIIAPRANYYILATYQNDISHEETRSSPIYSLPELGIVVGGLNSFSGGEIIPNLSVSNSVVTPYFFYVGNLAASYDDNFDDVSIVVKNENFSVFTEYLSFSFITNNTLQDDFDEVSVIIKKGSDLSIKDPYQWSSTSGILN